MAEYACTPMIGYSSVLPPSLTVAPGVLAGLPLAPVSDTRIRLFDLAALAASRGDRLADTLPVLWDAALFRTHLTGTPDLSVFPVTKRTRTLDGLCDASVVLPLGRGQARCPCTVFPVLKRDGESTRGVVNPAINDIWDNSAFPARLPPVLTRIRDLTRFSHAVTLDMRSAFYQFRLSPEVAEYFALRTVGGQRFMHQDLPMGFGPSVHFCQSTLLVVAGVALDRLCSRHHLDPDDFMFEGWVDNLLLASVSPDLVQLLVDEVLAVAEDIHMSIAVECKVSTLVVWCGLELNLTTKQYSLKQSWLDQARSIVQAVMSHSLVTPKEYQQAVGTLVYATYIQAFPLLDIRPLLLGLPDPSVSHVRITPDLWQCFDLTLKSILLSNVRPLTPPSMVIPHVLFTDASDRGLGAILVSPSRRRVLSAPVYGDLLPEHICTKEMYAVLWALNQFPHLHQRPASYLCGQHVCYACHQQSLQSLSEDGEVPYSPTEIGRAEESVHSCYIH